MRRFEELEVVGDGAFGVVTKCRDRDTGELVAIKKMKKRYSSFEECLQLKEVKSLRKIKHQNVVKLLQVFRENEYLFLVFELMGKSLLKTINENPCGYSENDVRSMMRQILTGLSYVHRQGFFHRDMKPDNVLWKGEVLKIGDFGLAREIRSRPPFTEYVSTRWYRAPEIILRAENYNSPVDIWASAIIMAELYISRPLFMGSSETDQLFKIFAVLGTPSQKNWPDCVRLSKKTGIRFTASAGTSLAAAVPNASPEALSLMSEMLRYDPAKRPSASQALQHPFFKGSYESVTADDTNSSINNTIDNTINNTIDNTIDNTNSSINNTIYNTINNNANFDANTKEGNSGRENDECEMLNQQQDQQPNQKLNQKPNQQQQDTMIISSSRLQAKEDLQLDDILSTFVKNNNNPSCISNTNGTNNAKGTTAVADGAGKRESGYESALKMGNKAAVTDIVPPKNYSALAKPSGDGFALEIDSDELFGKF